MFCKMKKCCGNCKHRINGTDTHMVCGIRTYVLRVSRTDYCSKWKQKLPIEGDVKEKNNIFYLFTNKKWKQIIFNEICPYCGK